MWQSPLAPAASARAEGMHLRSVTVRILTLKTVLVATDLRDTSLPAVEAAWGLARASGAALHVVHVLSGNEAGGDRTHAQLGSLGVPLDEAAVHTVTGDPGRGITKLAEEIGADVIVIGPHSNHAGRTKEASLGTALAIA